MPISIEFRPETGKLERGTEAVERALQGVADSLDDVARDGKTSVGRVEQSFEDLAREARDTSRRVDDIGDAGQRAGRDVKKGMDKAKEGLSEAKNEAQQSGREAAASFSGGFEDVADFVQETLANALGGFGPIGAAAGIAIAAAVGSALAGAANAQEKLQAARERAAELASTLYENNGKLPMEEQLQSLMSVLAEESASGNGLLNLIDQWVDFGSTLDAVRRTARATGLGLDTLTSSMSGNDLPTARRALASVNDEIERMESNVNTGWAWDDNLRALRETRDEIEKNVAAQELAADVAETSGARAAAAETARREALATAAGEYRAGVDAVGAAWQNAMLDASGYFKEAEDGTTQFDWESYLTDAEETLRAANEYKARIVGLPASIAEEAERIFNSQGAVAANTYAAAYESASAENRTRFETAATANGAAAGEAAGRAAGTKLVSEADLQLQSWYPKVHDPEATLKLNVAEAQARLDAFLRNNDGRRLSVTGGIRLPDWQ